jgi:hypothetical protein
MATHTHTDPTVIWRLHREGEVARAVIVPHTLQTTLVWWINDQIDGAEDFLEWSGALERADAVRARLMTDGWIDVS